MSSNERVSTLDSRRSTGGTTIPIASTTTIDEVAETTSYTNLHEAQYDRQHQHTTTNNILASEHTPLSQQQTTSLDPVIESTSALANNHLNNYVGNAIRMNNVTNMRRSGRLTKQRMRAAVQGLEADDSDQDMEVVDFTDGTNHFILTC